MAVRAEQGHAGLGEIFQVQLVADAGAGRRKHQTILGGDGAQKAMVIGVAKARLQSIVVHITDRKPGFNSGHAYGLKLQIGHGPGGVLRQRLVNAQSYGLARFHYAVGQVGGDYFFSKVHNP